MVSEISFHSVADAVAYANENGIALSSVQQMTVNDQNNRPINVDVIVENIERRGIGATIVNPTLVADENTAPADLEALANFATTTAQGLTDYRKSNDAAVKALGASDKNLIEALDDLTNRVKLLEKAAAK